MKLDELKAKLEALGLDRQGPGRPAAEVLELLEGAMSPAETRYHLYEIGLASPGRGLQVNWIHALRRDGLGNERRDRLAALKAGAVLEAGRLAEGASRAGFDLALFEEVLARLRASGSAGDRSLFSFEWDPEAARFSKLTLYGGIYQESEAVFLAKLLRVEEPRAAGWLARGDLWNFGVDFLPGGRAALKIYRRALFAEGPARRRLPAAALALHAERPFHDLASMTRVAPGARPPYPVKWGAGFERAVTVSELAASPALGRHAVFLKAAARRLGDLELSYVAWGGRGFGFYCGRDLKTWLKWLARPAASGAAA